VGETRLGAERGPGREGEHGDRDHGGHEYGGDAIDQALDRRAAALRLGDALHDAREERLAPDLVGAHHEAAAPVEGAADHARPRPLLDGDRLAGEHRFVDRAAPLEHLSVHGHLLAGSHPQAVVGGDAGERDVLLAAVGSQPPRRRGREAEQGADRGAGALAGAQLDHLPEQHERDDPGGGLEVDGHRAAVGAEAVREQARRDRRQRAVQEGCAGAERDQREHVEPPAREGARPAREEGPAAPQDHGRGQPELEPGERARRQALRQGRRREHLAHRQGQDDQGERRAREEAAPEIDELGVVLPVHRGEHRLERHAADRARARPDPHDPRVHRAGETADVGGGGLRGGSGGRDRGRPEEALGVGAEAREAALAAEPMDGAGVLVAKRRVLAHPHAADRVDVLRLAHRPSTPPKREKTSSSSSIFLRRSRALPLSNAVATQVSTWPARISLPTWSRAARAAAIWSSTSTQ
jgi:hypothetical protein